MGMRRKLKTSMQRDTDESSRGLETKKLSRRRGCFTALPKTQPLQPPSRRFPLFLLGFIIPIQIIRAPQTLHVRKRDIPINVPQMFRRGACIERRCGWWSERAGNTKVTVLLMGALSRMGTRIRGRFGVVVVVMMMMLMMSLGM